jgi:hypothetical protein
VDERLQLVPPGHEEASQGQRHAQELDEQEVEPSREEERGSDAPEAGSPEQEREGRHRSPGRRHEPEGREEDRVGGEKPDGRGGYLYLIEGELAVNDEKMATGDAAKVFGPEVLRLAAQETSELTKARTHRPISMRKEYPGLAKDSSNTSVASKEDKSAKQEASARSTTSKSPPVEPASTTVEIDTTIAVDDGISMEFEIPKMQYRSTRALRYRAEA